MVVKFPDPSAATSPQQCAEGGVCFLWPKPREELGTDPLTWQLCILCFDSRGFPALTLLEALARGLFWDITVLMGAIERYNASELQSFVVWRCLSS